MAARDHGQIRAFANSTYDAAKAIPTVVLRNEDYGRISRLIAEAQPVELEFDIVNRIYPEGRTSYNAIGRNPWRDRRGCDARRLTSIRGTRPRAQPTTPSACAVVMEAVRILKAVGVKPRRTIRVALWSGEEQGLRGSRAYVGSSSDRSKSRSRRSKSSAATSTSTPEPGARAI